MKDFTVDSFVSIHAGKDPGDENNYIPGLSPCQEKFSLLGAHRPNSGDFKAPPFPPFSASEGIFFTPPPVDPFSPPPENPVERGAETGFSGVENSLTELTKKGPLVTTYGITQPPPPSIFPQVVENKEIGLKRVEKWSLQAAARSALPNSKVCLCCRRVLSSDVTVLKKEDKRSYSGLLICSLPWVCPICASKISNFRRLELSAAIREFMRRLAGTAVWLFTQTFPHKYDSTLSESLEKISVARRKLLNRKVWKKWVRDNGIIGTVRALEVTHGGNGWHPHFHTIFFIELEEPMDPFNLMEEEFLLRKEWIKALDDCGLPGGNEHAATLQDGTRAWNYVAKWGLESELTKSHLKDGKKGGRNPLTDILRDIVKGKELKKNYSLFREYADSMKGRSQLLWSRGLKDNLKIEDVSDEIIAETPMEEAEIYATITLEQWRKILKKGLRGQVLEEARKDIDHFNNYLNSL